MGVYAGSSRSDYLTLHLLTRPGRGTGVLDEIVRRHEALRTTFAEADGSPVQVIAPFGGFSLPV